MIDEVNEIAKNEEIYGTSVATLRKSVGVILEKLENVKMRPILESAPFTVINDKKYRISVSNQKLVLSVEYGSAMSLDSAPDEVLPELYVTLTAYIKNYASEIKKRRKEAEGAVKDAKNDSALLSLING